MKRKIAILMAVVLLMLCFSGCANMVQQMENAEVRAAAEGMLDALIAGDAEAGCCPGRRGQHPAEIYAGL